VSPRPGEVRRQVEVKLPQPRLGSAEATTLVAELRNSLTVMDAKEEVLP